MDEFDKLYSEVVTEKKKRQKELKKINQASNRLGFICKVLDGFSKAVENGTMETVIHSFNDAD